MGDISNEMGAFPKLLLNWALRVWKTMVFCGHCVVIFGPYWAKRAKFCKESQRGEICKLEIGGKSSLWLSHLVISLTNRHFFPQQEDKISCLRGHVPRDLEVEVSLNYFPPLTCSWMFETFHTLSTGWPGQCPGHLSVILISSADPPGDIQHPIPSVHLAPRCNIHPHIWLFTDFSTQFNWAR